MCELESFLRQIIRVGMTGPHLEWNLSFIGGEEVVRSEVMDPSSTFSAKANTEDPYEGEASEETGIKFVSERTRQTTKREANISQKVDGFAERHKNSGRR
ncbi:hypothetical protein TNIN_121851 [Trichonephila inaurata madagascariensis]|uniref:Uncharacterized protein n=1 Tax=Trichonephila inaurata madagascariensis TaxID=2747483 RepID=A0A8X6WR01_9ARAC|nr:hypothetical protein TNIN_121851 [Trichonephila inaurata madagascariensis]